MTPRATFLIAIALSSSMNPGDAAAQRMTIIREQRVIRIPLRPILAVPTPVASADHRESRGPKCIDRARMSGASALGMRTIDINLDDGTHLRAKLQNNCPAIDYYGGFYLKPTPDGKICADRDAFHARSGGECQIDSFRKLTPRRK